MDVLIAIAVLFAVAVICSVLLTFAATYFSTKGSERQNAIRDALPGVNCGACGYSGCDAYAKALAEGECDKTNLCVPGGDKTARAVAGILGVAAGEIVEQVAFVGCNGTCNTVDKKYIYEGLHTCRTANIAYSGDRVCGYACLGYGDCVRACPTNSISIIDGIARVNPRKCIGCGICTRECPNHLFKLINDTTRVVVECSNHDKGVVTRRGCKNGCIACGKCEKSCPHDAIHVIDNLATIDYSKCTGCGVCASACPTHCIHEGNFICGAHF